MFVCRSVFPCKWAMLPVTLLSLYSETTSLRLDEWWLSSDVGHGNASGCAPVQLNV